MDEPGTKAKSEIVWISFPWGGLIVHAVEENEVHPDNVAYRLNCWCIEEPGWFLSGEVQ